MKLNTDSDCVIERNEDRWLTRLEVADRLRLPKTTLDQWAARKIGPRYAVFGRHARYRLSDVVAWEESQIGAPATG
jgi:excisionase family DNA binding protein